MTSKPDPRSQPARADKPLSRRDFVKAGAVAGIGAAAPLPTAAAAVQNGGAGRDGIQWDYEYDVVVVGGGCAGLTAAIRARDAGASVLLVEASHDIGGRTLLSGSLISLGGGDPVQRRDMAGERDAEGFIEVGPVEPPEALDDNVELLFTDLTEWSIVDVRGQHPYRYNERETVRAWAENCPATRQFLMDNYVRFARVSGTHHGGGMSRARMAGCFLMLGDATDMRAGTVTIQDAGIAEPERASAFAPNRMGSPGTTVGPGAVSGGAALSRPLEFSAREKGVQFMVSRAFEELVREEPFAGRILGIKATYSPRHDPQTGELLQSFWQNGNVDERRDVLHVRARRAVVLACGGHAGNPQLRSMFYPAMREPAFTTSGAAALGPHAQDGSALKAGLKVGANLAGMHQNLTSSLTYHVSTRLGTPDAYTSTFPGTPTFAFRGSAGLSVGAAGFRELIAVNQVGKRFFNEARLIPRGSFNRYPGNGVAPNPGVEHEPHDWRNCSSEWIRQTYDLDHGVDAALAINEGSEAPHYYSGPLWAVFDQAAVERNGWELRFPYVADNGYSFQADTIEELAARIEAGHPYQRVPLRHLADTVATWNRYVADGADPEFERDRDGTMHPIGEPPFYALAIMVVWHDSYGGLRVNGRQQVVDLEGSAIPGLYAAGEATGGFDKHGLGKGTVQGYIAGTHAVTETEAITQDAAAGT